MSMRVLAAMSGGVDSAVAAALAVDAGHDVTGVHLALSPDRQVLRSGARGCCSVEDAHDARRVADELAGGPGRLPGNAHLSFPGAEGDALLMLLDARGIECSTGSACSAGVARPSHVLLATGADPDRARSSLRFSLGSPSTDADVDALLAVIAPVVERARRAGR